MITTRSIGMDDIKPSDAESYPIRLCASLVAHWKKHASSSNKSRNRGN